MDAQEIIAQLDDTERRLKPIAGLDAATHGRSYAEGKWTATQIFAHMADVETVFYFRFMTAAAEAGTRIVPFDEGLWQIELQGDRRPVALSMAIISATHAVLAHHLRTLPAERLGRLIIHPERGPLSPLRIGKIVAGHTLHHLRQLESIRDGRPWTKAEAVPYYVP